MTPDLAALYCALPGHEVLPAIDEMLMIDPPPCFIKVAATAWLQRNTPVRSMSMVRCQSFRGTSVSGWPV